MPKDFAILTAEISKATFGLTPSEYKNVKGLTKKNQKQYILPWKNSAPYVELFIKAIMEYKNEIFIYLQSYYRAFMREKNAEEFPVFEIDGEE